MTIPRTPLAAVRAFAHRHDLLRPGPLVVAVSGGADSTALVLLLNELAPDLGLVLHVAHFDHRARTASAKDAAFVADLAAKLALPIRVGRAARAPKSEDDARRQRYAFLRRVAASIGAAAIATGHTRDDQAETVLLHAVRGSGLAGLAGMRPERDGIVRPLLTLSRQDTRAICNAARITPRTDPTNRSLRFARNRIRLKVIPELARLNPRATDALARLADAAAAALASQTDRSERLLEGACDGDTIDLVRLGAEPNQREEALALAWSRKTGRTLTSRGRAALAALASRTNGTERLDLAGGRAERRYTTLHIGAPGSGRAPRNVSPCALVLEDVIEWGDWRLKLTRAASRDGWPFAAGVPAELAEGLEVRARRPGDRLAGEVRRKVQDVLTDAKVAVADRDRHPLIVTRAGEVWWVPAVTTRPLGTGMTVLARPAGDRIDLLDAQRVQVASTPAAARADATEGRMP